jgi:hypothetical protein
LHDALLADGIGQFRQRLGGEFLARLQGGRTDAVQRHALNSVAVVGRGRGGYGRWNDRGGRRLCERWLAAHQRAQTASQCRFCHARRMSQPRRKVNLAVLLDGAFPPRELFQTAVLELTNAFEKYCERIKFSS